MNWQDKLKHYEIQQKFKQIADKMSYDNNNEERSYTFFGQLFKLEVKNHIKSR